MKLLNRSLLYISVTFLVVLSAWSVVFYINLKDEIRDSIDDGLENSRLLILQKIRTDSTLLWQNDFGGNNFEMHPITRKVAMEMKDVYKDTLMYRLNEDDLEPVRLLSTAIAYKERYYHLRIISSLIEEDDLIEESLHSIFWLFIALIASIIVINNFVLRKVWNPFYEILSRLNNYRLDRAELPINSNTRTHEFLQLQQASNALIQHSKEAYTSQKQFTENAAHELQTPIAIIINKLELLLESENLKEKEANAIAGVIDIADRLKKLNNSLLLLAKIENKQFGDEEKVHINSLVNKLLDNFQDLADFRKIDFEVVEKDDLYIQMNTALAEILISNLIKNAFSHNRKEGKMRVLITGNDINICNTGPSMELDPKLIFNRFEKDPSKVQSTGLGLAICKAICDLYGIGITYRFEEGEHCFSLTPVAVR